MFRQPWRPRHSLIEIPRPVSVYRQTYHQRNVSNYSSQHASSETPSQIDDREHPSSSHVSTSIPTNGYQQTKAQPTKRSISQDPNPWIVPESLSVSLEAHRQANREGVTRDGIPVKIHSKRQRSGSRQKSPTGPWAGLDTLHLKKTAPAHERKLEYEGICPPLSPEWQPSEGLTERLRYPWLSQITSTVEWSDAPASTRLSAELRACNSYFSPSYLEKQAALAAASQITNILHQVSHRDVSVELVGSRAAGTDKPNSDLDINVTLSHSTEAGAQSAPTIPILRNLEAGLRKAEFRDLVVVHSFVKKTKVPIIVGTHIPTGLEFQLQSTDSVHDSLQVIKAFIAEYPTSSILFRVLKQMLSMRGLTAGSFGGVTSYPLLNMVITSLKLGGPRIAADDVTSQFLYFLEFWTSFNFDELKIVLTDLGLNESPLGSPGHAMDPTLAVPTIVRKDNSMANVYNLSLQDPANAMNDLGSNMHSYRHLQACLIETQHNVLKAMQEWNSSSSTVGTKRVTRSLLAWCLGGNYTSYEEARWQLNKYLRRVDKEEL